MLLSLCVGCFLPYLLGLKSFEGIQCKILLCFAAIIQIDLYFLILLSLVFVGFISHCVNISYFIY